MSILTSFLLAVLVTSQPLTESDRQAFIYSIANHQQGRWMEAIEGYRQILETHSKFVPARLYLAEALWLSGHEEDARRELEACVAQAPGLLLPLLLLGNQEALASELSDPNLADRLRGAIKLEQRKFVPVGLPSLVLLSSGLVEQGLKDYRIASALDPGEPELDRLVGTELAKARRFLEASEAFEKALAMRPNDAESWRQLGSSYLAMVRWDSAIQAFEKAISLGERSIGTTLALGYAYERKADFNKALEIYREGARLNPSSSQAHYRIGRVLVELNELSEAEAAFHRALELDPKMASALSHLGSVYLKRGDLTSAAEKLEKAIELDPNFYEAYYHLSQVYWRTDRQAEARQLLATYNELKRKYGGRPQ